MVRWLRQSKINNGHQHHTSATRRKDTSNNVETDTDRIANLPLQP